MKSSTIWPLFIAFTSIVWGTWSYSLAGGIGLVIFAIGLLSGDQIGGYWAHYKRTKKRDDP